MQLNSESLSVNGNDVLAMSGSLKYDIKLMRGGGMAAGGLFTAALPAPACSRLLYVVLCLRFSFSRPSVALLTFLYVFCSV